MYSRCTEHFVQKHSLQDVYRWRRAAGLIFCRKRHA